MSPQNLLQTSKGKVIQIIKIEGGKSFQDKAESLGLRIGVKVNKLSTQVMSGPITLQVGNSKIALGRGMAQKIFVSEGE